MDAEPADRRGHRLPSTLEAITTRNALLVEAANRHFAGMSARQVATHLHVALARYAAGRWRRSRADPGCPHAAGTLAAALWAILRTRDHVVSERAIRRTLADAIHGPRIGV
jgi:hypothetical protein